MSDGTRLAWANSPDVLDAIETELAPAVREALGYIRGQLGIDPDAWTDVTCLRLTFAMSAVASIMERAVNAGATEDAAIEIASRRLGIPPKTIGSWVGRRKTAIRKAGERLLHTAGGPPAASAEMVRTSKP